MVPSIAVVTSGYAQSVIHHAIKSTWGLITAVTTIVVAAMLFWKSEGGFTLVDRDINTSVLYDSLLVLNTIADDPRSIDSAYCLRVLNVRSQVVTANDGVIDSLYNGLVIKIFSNPYSKLAPISRVVLETLTQKRSIDSAEAIDQHLAHQLRYWGNFNAARSLYARGLASATLLSISDANANLAMEYDRIGCYRSALKHALIADSVFNQYNRVQGRIWTQRLLYNIYMRLNKRTDALQCLDNFRTYHFRNVTSERAEVIDTTTDLNLISSILQYPSADKDIQRAFGRSASLFMQLYKQYSLHSPSVWKNGWLPSRVSSIVLPKPVVREIEAKSTMLQWTDSIVPSVSGRLVHESALGSFILDGNKWVLVDSARQNSRIEINTAALKLSDTIYHARSAIRSVLPIGIDSLLVIRDDSLVLINDKRRSVVRCPNTMKSVNGALDLCKTGSDCLMMVNARGAFLIDSRTYSILSSVLFDTCSATKYFYNAHWEAEINPLGNNIYLVKQGRSSNLWCIQFDPFSKAIKPINLAVRERTSSNTTTTFMLFSVEGIFTSAFSFNGRDTLWLTKNTPSHLGSKYTSKDDLTPSPLHAPKYCRATRLYDMIDIIETREGKNYPQFAVPIPMDANSMTDVGIYRDRDDSLCAYYNDGHSVVRIPLSQRPCPSRPILHLGSPTNTDVELNTDRSYSIFSDQHQDLFFTFNTLTFAPRIIVNNELKFSTSWIYSGENVFWHIRVLPNDKDSVLFVKDPIANELYKLSIVSPLLSARWRFVLVISALSIIISTGGVLLFRYRRKRQREKLEAAKSQQLELIREDMHDMIGSRLVRIASLARQASPENNEEVLARIHDMTIVTVRSLRNLLTLMSESTMSDAEFYGSMREYVMESCKDARIECTINVNVHHGTTLDNAGRHELLMIISEMLTNTIRHASATQATFSVIVRDGNTVITWSDNGTGIDPASKLGNGVNNIRRRAARINASVSCDTTPSEGTHYTITFSNMLQS